MQPAAAASDSEPKGEGGAANENIPTGEFFEQVFPPSQLPRATSAKKQFEETDEYQHDRAQQHMASGHHNRYPVRTMLHHVGFRRNTLAV